MKNLLHSRTDGHHLFLLTALKTSFLLGYTEWPIFNWRVRTLLSRKLHSQLVAVLTWQELQSHSNWRGHGWDVKCRTWAAKILTFKLLSKRPNFSKWRYFRSVFRFQLRFRDILRVKEEKRVPLRGRIQIHPSLWKVLLVDWCVSAPNIQLS